MAWVLFIFKMLIVLGLLVFGGWLVLTNRGIIPSVSVGKTFEAHDLPIGIACIVAAVFAAIYWKVQVKTEHSSDGNGFSSTVTTILGITKNPFDRS